MVYFKAESAHGPWASESKLEGEAHASKMGAAADARFSLAGKIGREPIPGADARTPHRVAVIVIARTRIIAAGISDGGDAVRIERNPDALEP